MSTTAPTEPTRTTPERVREALRLTRLAHGSYRDSSVRTAFATLELAVAALLTEHEQLLQRVAVATEGAQATVEAADSVATILRLVRAHLELALDASVAGRARAHKHRAVALLHDLGVERPDAATLATATVAVTP